MSLYLPQQNLVFVHVPKAAGTWVKAAIAAAGIPHEPARGAGSHNLPWAYENPGRRFCFVRHPISWYESVWRALSGMWPQKQAMSPLAREHGEWSPILLATRLFGERDFVAFVESMLARQPGFVSRMYEWYAGPPGAPLVDYVGRAEDAASHLEAILRICGWRGALPAVPRQNEGGNPAPDWPWDLKARVLAAEAVAINRFYNDEPSADGNPTGAGPFVVRRE